MGQTLLAPSAQTDLLEAWLFITQENPAALIVLWTRSGKRPALWHRSPGWCGRGPNWYQVSVAWPTSTLYVLFYLTDKQGITVVRVLHHARDVNRATF